MASWTGVTTNAGVRLMASWTSGTTLNIDKAVAGEGCAPIVSLLAQTALVKEKQKISIVSSKIENDARKIKVQIQSGKEGYLLNQIGLFASVDSGEQVLLALFQNERGIDIPSSAESPDFLYTFYCLLAVSNQGEFSCTVDSAACVSQGTMEEYVRANADPCGAAAEVQANLNSHNTNTEAHADLRLELQALTDRINAVLDSDDTTLDELSEIVAYIKSNKSLIDAITISKVNVTDIIDNLVSNVSNKPLSAAQGVVLKELIDTVTSKVNAFKTEPWTLSYEDGTTRTVEVYVK